jgi:hypothetical protein
VSGDEAFRLVAAKSETEDAPDFSLRLARTYWKAGGPAAAKRAWQDVMHEIPKLKTGNTRHGWETGLSAARIVFQPGDIWDIGAVAASGHPDALKLVRKILLASSSIPVAFPPVLFEVEVEADGRRYDEMHADGTPNQRKHEL